MTLAFASLLGFSLARVTPAQHGVLDSESRQSLTRTDGKQHDTLASTLLSRTLNGHFHTADGPQQRPRFKRCRSVEHFEALCERVEERRLLVDGAVAADIAALSDAEDFFLFAEPLRAAALAFSRDPSAAAHAAAPPHPRLVGLGRGGQRHGLYPPGGVLPHSGAAALLAPLPYLFPTAAGVMLCHRALYCRYACCGARSGCVSLPRYNLTCCLRQH